MRWITSVPVLLVLGVLLLGCEREGVPENLSSEDEPAGAATYVVQPGDSLAQLAEDFGVALPELIAANELADPSIETGQVLTIPASAANPPTAPEEGGLAGFINRLPLPSLERSAVLNGIAAGVSLPLAVVLFFGGRAAYERAQTARRRRASAGRRTIRTPQAERAAEPVTEPATKATAEPAAGERRAKAREPAAVAAPSVPSMTAASEHLDGAESNGAHAAQPEGPRAPRSNGANGAGVSSGNRVRARFEDEPLPPPPPPPPDAARRDRDPRRSPATGAGRPAHAPIQSAASDAVERSGAALRRLRSSLANSPRPRLPSLPAFGGDSGADEVHRRWLIEGRELQQQGLLSEAMWKFEYGLEEAEREGWDEEAALYREALERLASRRRPLN